MRKRILIIISLLCFFSIANGSLKAQRNVDYYIKAAFENNPNIKEFSNLIYINDLNKSLINSQFISPHISLTSNLLIAPYFNNNGKFLSANPDPNAIGYDNNISNGGLYSAQINFEKSIFNGFLIDAYHKQSDLLTNSNQFSIETLKHDIQRDVTELYLKCYESQQLYILAKSIADTLAIQLKITGDMVDRGFATQSDLLLLKIEVENQIMAADLYRAGIISNLFAMNAICGLNDTAIVKFEEVKLGYESDANYSNFLKRYKTDSLMIINQQEIFETKYQPQVNLFFNAGLNAVELNNIQRKFGFSTGINLALQIFDGGQKSLTQQQSHILLNTIKSNKDNMIIMIGNKIKESVSQLELNKNNLTKIREQIKNYEAVIEIIRGELKRGHYSMVDFLTIIKNYFELEKTEVTASVAYQQAINQYNYWNW